VENKSENVVMTTQEACHYLRISRPTYLKYLYLGKIKGAKAGKGWKVLKSELDRFLKGEDEYSSVHRMDSFNGKDSGGGIW
jgi:excisionase family DNA binding protein